VAAREIVGMANTPAQPAGRSLDLLGPPLTADHIVVPLDGSEYAERALEVADRFASLLGATVCAVSVCDSELGRQQMVEYYEKLVARTGRTALEWKLPIENAEPGPPIVAAVETWSNPVACMSSHGKGRLAASVLGSVTHGVLATSARPAIVCGPGCESPGRDRAAGALPVGACVDGSDAADTVLRVAAAWAKHLHTDVHVITVAEPAPPTVGDDERFRRAHGPSIDADLYVSELARAVHEVTGVGATPHAVYDPLSVASGISQFLASNPMELLVVATRNRSGLAQLVVGSQAARIVRDSTVPVVMVGPERPGER
jgi:nucleotide-binding universal stress UspA family protein